MVRHKVTGETIQDVLQWQCVVKDGDLVLQCKEGATNQEFNVLHVRPDGTGIRFLGLPGDIGLNVDADGRLVIE